MKVRNEFRFTLPNGTGIKSESGRKVTGTMRLIKVSDIVSIERDLTVQKNSGAYYVVLLGKVVKELGTEPNVNRNTIEKLNPVDFAFLVDFMHEINHQIIKKINLECPKCKTKFSGEFDQLGEA